MLIVVWIKPTAFEQERKHIFWEKIMTYKELFNKLCRFTPEQLNMDVTVYDSGDDEFYAVADYQITEEDDVLDKNHPFFVI